MIHKKIIGLFFTFTLVITSTLSLADTYKHSLGEIEINGVPKRVVVLGFGSLDFVDALGVTPIAMPKNLLPEALSKYKAEQFINTGSLQEVNYETLFTLKPDLIIAEIRMSALYKDLSSVAPTYMFEIDSNNYWKSTQQHWKNISKILGKEEQGTKLISDIQSKIDTLKKEQSKSSPKALTVMSNGSNITSFDANGRFSFIYNEAAFKPAISNDVKTTPNRHGNLISFEYIADAKPDVLFILDRDQAIGKEIGRAEKSFDNPLVNSTPAAKNKRIVYLDPAAWYLTAGGFNSLKTMISDLERAIR
jgi:iron complex transport system substrate-binding protein